MSLSSLIFSFAKTNLYLIPFRYFQSIHLRLHLQKYHLGHFKKNVYVYFLFLLNFLNI